jgi:hypothetical protein
MIEGGWNFVYAAYAVAGVALAVLAAIVVLRLRHWARRAKDLNRP